MTYIAGTPVRPARSLSLATLPTQAALVPPLTGERAPPSSATYAASPTPSTPTTRTWACKGSPASTPSSRPLVAVTPSAVLRSPALWAVVAANELGELAQQVEAGVTHVVER